MKSLEDDAKSAIVVVGGGKTGRGRSRGWDWSLHTRLCCSTAVQPFRSPPRGMRTTARWLFGAVQRGPLTITGRRGSVILDPSDPISAPRAFETQRSKPCKSSSGDSKWDNTFCKLFDIHDARILTPLISARMLASPLRRTIGSDQYMPRGMCLQHHPRSQTRYSSLNV